MPRHQCSNTKCEHSRGWDASPSQGYPQQSICQYPFITLGEERHCQKKCLGFKFKPLDPGIWSLYLSSHSSKSLVSLLSDKLHKNLFTKFLSKICLGLRVCTVLKNLTLNISWFLTSINTLDRPSDRVRGCGTAQFGQTRTITHNPRKFAKSRTIRKSLLEILNKTGISIEYQDF